MLLALGSCLVGMAVGAYVFRGELAQMALRNALSRFTQDGPLLTVERIEPRGLHGVTLQGVHLVPGIAGAGAAPAGPGALTLDVEAVELRWSLRALLGRRLALTAAELVAPRLQVDLRAGPAALHADLQAIEALAARLRRARGQQSGAPASADAPAARGDGLPALAVSGGEAELRGLGLGVRNLSLELAPAGAAGERILTGTLEPVGLAGGPCRVSGQLLAGLQRGTVQLDCEQPLSLEHGRVALHTSQLRLELGEEASLVPEAERRSRLLVPAPATAGPRISLFLPQVVAVAPAPGDPTPRPRLSGALRIVLAEGATLGLEADLRGDPSGTIVMVGQLQPRDRTASLDLQIGRLDLASSPLPALLPGTLSQGTLDADLALDLVDSGKRLDLIGKVQVKDLLYAHPGLAREPIPFASLKADIDLAVTLAERRIESAASQLEINRIPLVVDGELDLGRAAPRVGLRLATGKLAVEDLVQSLPRQLVPRLRPRGASGTCSFQASLQLDMARPEDVVITIEPDVAKIELESLGPGLAMENLLVPFVHTWEDEEREELFKLPTGPGSPAWTPIAEIPPLLLTAVIAQEDGGFLNHKGFSRLHVKGALVQNLQSGRFARGASTITMQLARNLFLSREKLLSRKLQEVILAWRLEQELSKQSILELYLNIIEWGPGVFGLRAAAEHYFGKRPAQLSLAECVFLSTAIPRPRLVHRAFLEGRVSKLHLGRIKWMLNLLRNRGHIDEFQLARSLAETFVLRDPATAPALPNLWETVPHREGAHGVAPSPPEPETDEADEEDEDEDEEDEEDRPLPPAPASSGPF